MRWSWRDWLREVSVGFHGKMSLTIVYVLNYHWNRYAWVWISTDIEVVFQEFRVLYQPLHKYLGNEQRTLLLHWWLISQFHIYVYIYIYILIDESNKFSFSIKLVVVGYQNLYFGREKVMRFNLRISLLPIY